MKYYDEFVVPQCPIQAGCTCQIKQIQENVITTDKRIYTVHVNCTGKGLQHFPAMPERTQTVDLSDNQVCKHCKYFDFKKHRYFLFSIISWQSTVCWENSKKKIKNFLQDLCWIEKYTLGIWKRYTLFLSRCGIQKLSRKANSAIIGQIDHTKCLYCLNFSYI